jgi:acetyl esterase/lipase
MNRKFCFLTLILLLAGVVGSAAGQTPAINAENWVDYAAVDYDIKPNITYSIANNTELKLDLYLPKNLKAPNPTLMLFHGGGWVDGAKERNIFYLLPYLSMGWTVINVEYRMAKNSPAPAAVEDCRCALRWVAYNAKENNIDTTRIVTTGTSAGGHLALMTGMLPANSIFDRQCPTAGQGRWDSPKEPEIKVAAVVNWFGIADVAEIVEGPNAKHYAMEWLGSRSDRLELARQLSPVNNVRKDNPAVITIHGELDDIAPYGAAVRMHAELEKAGVPNQLITLKGRKHGGFSREEMAAGMASIRAFLRKNNILKP